MADKKVALTTGANKGIGKEIRRQLGALVVFEPKRHPTSWLPQER